MDLTIAVAAVATLALIGVSVIALILKEKLDKANREICQEIFSRLGYENALSENKIIVKKQQQIIGNQKEYIELTRHIAPVLQAEVELLGVLEEADEVLENND